MGGNQGKAAGGRRRDARCSFCGKRQDEVKKLIAGPGVYICDRCVRLCNEVLADDAGRPGGAGRCSTRPARRRRGPLFRLRHVLRTVPAHAGR